MNTSLIKKIRYHKITIISTNSNNTTTTMTTTNVERRFSLGMSSEFHQRPKTPTKWNWNSFSRRVLPSHVHRKFHKTPRWQQKFKDQRYPPKKFTRSNTPKNFKLFPPLTNLYNVVVFFSVEKKGTSRVHAFSRLRHRTKAATPHRR